jgi:SAM-dependent methyltransferase
MRVGRRGLSFWLPATSPVQTVDILIDGSRVWSTTLPPPDQRGRRRLLWPLQLAKRVRGRGVVTVRDSSTAVLLAEARVRIGRKRGPFDIRDGQGRRLSVNKWHRLGPTFEGDDSGGQARLLARSRLLATQLEELGYLAYITGGTLLGAVRSGEMLPHDDDTDFGVLFDATDPADLALASYRMEDELAALGYTVVRHSAAHLQITFFSATGSIENYIDIFSAFCRPDGEFCQPIHVRGQLPREAILPLTTLTLGGVEFPSVAEPERWLELCYGPGWRTPDPSFRFVTPLPTRRRFESWFGSQNLNRVYWEAYYAALGADEPSGDDRFLRTLLARLEPGADVLDLGCGTGQLTKALAAEGHRAHGVDYSYAALALARAKPVPGARFSHLNLYDRRRVLELAAEIVRSGTSIRVTARDLLTGLTEEGRENVLLFLRLVLPGDGFALATIDTDYSVRWYRGDNPETWHLPLAGLRREAAAQDLEVEVLRRGRRSTDFGIRSTATVLIRPRRAGE